MRSIEWRLRYLDWRIVQLKAEIAVWHAAHPLADVWEQALDKDLAKIWRRLEPLQKKRRVELAAQEPLDDWYRGRENYHGYLDSPRWKRKREMKFVAVNGRCEYPGCLAFAEECHHKHYDNVGSETNGDLVALCSGHHRMVHAYY